MSLYFISRHITPYACTVIGGGILVVHLFVNLPAMYKNRESFDVGFSEYKRRKLLEEHIIQAWIEI